MININFEELIHVISQKIYKDADSKTFQMIHVFFYKEKCFEIEEMYYCIEIRIGEYIHDSKQNKALWNLYEIIYPDSIKFKEISKFCKSLEIKEYKIQKYKLRELQKIVLYDRKLTFSATERRIKIKNIISLDNSN